MKNLKNNFNSILNLIGNQSDCTVWGVMWQNLCSLKKKISLVQAFCNIHVVAYLVRNHAGHTLSYYSSQDYCMNECFG